MKISEYSFILLGSNMGDREGIITQAIDMIVNECGDLIDKSYLYESESWGFETEQWFLNQVIEIKSTLSPQRLIYNLLSIETQLGRDRLHHYDNYVSRVIDLDILYYDNLVMNNNIITLPHPKLHLRRFTLLPLCDIAPDFIHPVLNKPNKELLNSCKDISAVKLYKSRDKV